MRIVVAAAVLALAFPAASIAQSVIENFDHLAEQTIDMDRPLTLDHFRIEILGHGRDAAIVPAVVEDELAAGMTLGIAEGQSLATMFLYFNQPWRRADITFVIPPSEDPVHSVASFYGESEHPHSMTVQHSRAGHRVRVSMAPSTEASFTSMVLHLQRGAYVDNIELH